MLYLPLADPIFVSQLHIEVKDEDVTFDDTLGSIRFSVQKIRDGKYRKPFWAHIYGAPIKSGNTLGRGTKSEAQKQMDSNPKIGRQLCLTTASTFKGSVLMLIDIAPNPQPKYTSEVMITKAVEQVLTRATKDYTVVVDVSSVFGLLLPHEGSNQKKYEVEVSCGPNLTSLGISVEEGSPSHWCVRSSLCTNELS